MNQEELIEGLRAVAHPLRYRILEALRGSERNVSEIEGLTQIGQPTLSQQLAVLRGAGLVHTRKAAKLVFYRIDQTALGTLSAAIAGFGEAVPQVPAKRPAVGAANFARLG